MIFLTLPAMLIALIPVFIIEAYIIKGRLLLRMKQSLATSFMSNLVSTVIGMPLAWSVLALIEMLLTGGRAYGLQTFWGKFVSVVVQAPWLIPYEEDFYWIVPSAILVLLVPFFFASWWSEYVLTRWLLRTENLPKDRILNAVLVANLYTYSLLALVALGKLLIGERT